MSQINPIINGQKPAFPETEGAVCMGLTKREHFAAQFMAAYLAADEIGEPREYLADAAVSAADALLVALAKSEATA